MSIVAACACGQRVKVNDSLAGKRVKCPKCTGPIVVPGDAPVASPATAPPQPLAAATNQSPDLVGLDLSDLLSPLPSAPAAPQPGAMPMGPQFGPQQYPATPAPQGAPYGAPHPQQYAPQPYAPQQYAPQPGFNPYQAPNYQPAPQPGQFPGQAPIRGHKPLTPEQRTRYNMLSFALGIPGLLAYFGAGVLSNMSRAQNQPVLGMVSLVVLVLAIAMLGAGLAFSAMYKGYHPALGLLGLLCIIGLIIIAILPDKGAPLPQYAMHPQQPMPPQWPGPPR